MSDDKQTTDEVQEDEALTLRFTIDTDDFSFEELAALASLGEKGVKPQFHVLLPLLARCLVDKQGQPVDEIDALRILRPLKDEDLAAAFNAFAAAIDDIVPPQSGSD